MTTRTYPHVADASLRSFLEGCRDVTGDSMADLLSRVRTDFDGEADALEPGRHDRQAGLLEDAEAAYNMDDDCEAVRDLLGEFFSI